ncbi:MAG: tight adherence protein, partial [Actinomycetota bacterium]|nr:tight adherence protein [Actinomycetota bacterium]
AGVSVTSVNTGGFPTVHATVVSSRGADAVPSVTENGRPVAGLIAQNLGHAKAVVMAIDDSRSMAGGPLRAAVAAARDFIASKPRADAIAVLAFGPHPIQLSGLSTATIDTDVALRGVRLAGRQGTALYDAIVQGAGQLRASPLVGRVLIVLTDGSDVSSTATLENAVSIAREAAVSVYPIGIESPGFNPAPLQQIARETGGRYYGTASTAALAGVYSSIAKRLGHTWSVSYVTAARPGDHVQVAASVAGAGSSSFALIVPPQSGDVSTPPAPSRLLPKFVYGPAGGIVVGLVAGALVLAAFLLLLGRQRSNWLRVRLQAHTGGARRTKRVSREQRLAALTGLLRGTERAFGHLRHWKRVQTMLERGETPLRAAEFAYIVFGSSLLLGMIMALFGAPAIVILGGLLFGAAIPFTFVWYRMRKRLNTFETQLPDLLITIAASLKAGHSFKQGLQAVVDEGAPPASSEFNRVLTETGLGRSIDDALTDMASRVGSDNFEFAITAVSIQRQVGGSLATLFDMVADTVRQRQQFARKIRSLTAMGRMSAYTLIGLPFFLALAISLLNPGYLRALLHSSTGHMLLFVGAAMMVVGSALLQKIVSFKG